MHFSQIPCTLSIYFWKEILLSMCIGYFTWAAFEIIIYCKNKKKRKKALIDTPKFLNT